MHALPRHRSITHLHIFAVTNTLLGKRSWVPGNHPIRILDIGCGDGWLMRYLVEMFALVHPEQSVEVHGFDVHEQGYGVREEFERAVRNLADGCPDTDWARRIKIISAAEPWPYAEEFFDIAVSNQVLEHVADIQHYFSSLRRVLKADGFSVQLLPVSQVFLEGHVRVPLAHWIRDVRLQQDLIEVSNRIGIGLWKRDRLIFEEADITQYAKSQAAYLNTSTFYRTFDELYRACNKNRLAISYHYTKDFYFAKLRHLAGRRPRLRYRSRTMSIVELLSFLALRYVSAVTLAILPLSYDLGRRIHAEKSHLAVGR
jgi:SAM-dependent methyltransferase